jgi:hypothetical protein
MQWSDIPFDPPRRTLRQFAGLSLVVFGGLAGWNYFAKGQVVSSAVLAVLAVAIGLPGLVRPRLVRPVYVGAMILAFPIGWVVSRLLLAILFYGIVTPMGLVLRLSGRDPLRLARPAARTTYWVAKPEPADLRSYFRQF